MDWSTIAMGMYAPKRPAVRVRTDWMGLHPTRPMSFWIEVGRRVKARRITQGDLRKVRSVIAEVEAEWSRARHKRSLRDE